MARDDVNRNVLLGLLARQMDFVSRDGLFAAMNAWIRHKEQPIGELFVERGDLAEPRRDLLETLVDEHIRAHGGDSSRSLQALGSVATVTADLGLLADPDLQDSLSVLTVQPSIDPFATRGPETTADQTEPFPDATDTVAPLQSSSPSCRYRVVRPHASGGLGRVSVALDDELDREVAFKEIKEEYADWAGSRARFILEAEITGKLEHPGIIPIYGLGEDGNGRPFYAMRFIRGDSLADAIRRYHDPGGPHADRASKSMMLRELLARFLDICDAVAYAHSRGVLHRDLKPGNVMLGPFGETLVVDWGLALPLQEVPRGHESIHSPVKTTKADSASLRSVAGTVVGTPAYMPPEQAGGEIDRLGPWSDVYSLGGILYELLTGKHPIEGKSLEQVLRRVGQGEITPPRQVRPEITPALESVCLKALALKPEDRYQSPRQLAADIKAWLADEPVSARREPFSEWASRWARRNRTTVVAAGVALVVGIAALVAVAIQRDRSARRLASLNLELTNANIEVEESRKLAEQGSRQAREAVDTYLTKVSQSRLLDVPGLQPLRKELLETALGYYREFLRDNRDDPRLARESARALYQVGKIVGQIGSETEALDDLARSLASLETLARRDPNDLGLLGDIAEVETAIGSIRESRFEFRLAMEAYARASAIRERLASGPKARPIDRSKLAFALTNLGRTKGRNGLPHEELADLRRAIELNEAVIREDSREETLRELGNTHLTLISLDVHRGKSAEAMASSVRARAIFEALHRDHPEVADYTNDLAVALDLQSFVLRTSGRIDEALAASEASQGLFRGLVDANPRVISYQASLAMSYNMAGDLARQLGRIDALGDFAKKATDLLQGLQRANPQSTAYTENLSKAFNNLGRFQAAKGLRAEAKASFERTVALVESLPAQDPVSQYNLACNLALEASVTGDPADLKPLEREERDKLAQRAIGALRKAIAGGMTSLEMYREDDDLKPLRDRDDFQALLRDLAKPTPSPTK